MDFENTDVCVLPPTDFRKGHKHNNMLWFFQGRGVDREVLKAAQQEEL